MHDDVLAEATMSNPHLPAEMLDHVVDKLHDTEDALRNCSLVSKSWIPRARKHLFADVGFETAGDLQSWKKTFPDPSTSPRRYVKNLSVSFPQAFTAADAEAGDWIRGFSCVVHLEVGSPEIVPDRSFSLVLFHGFSPSIKSLGVTFAALPSPLVLNLILSFPLLEDLVAISFYNPSSGNGDGSHWLPTTAQPSSSPMFTGSLELLLRGGKDSFARRLLSLPGGIHFRKLNVTWIQEKDPSLMTRLVEGCSHTLESLEVYYGFHGASILPLCPYR